jgi:hypothetical protein
MKLKRIQDEMDPSTYDADIQLEYQKDRDAAMKIHNGENVDLTQIPTCMPSGDDTSGVPLSKEQCNVALQMKWFGGVNLLPAKDMPKPSWAPDLADPRAAMNDRNIQGDPGRADSTKPR